MASKKEDTKKLQIPLLNVSKVVLTPVPDTIKEPYFAPKPVSARKSPQPPEVSYRGHMPTPTPIATPHPKSMGVPPPKSTSRKCRPKSLGTSPTRKVSLLKSVTQKARRKSIESSPTQRTTSRSGTGTVSKSKRSKSSESKSPVKKRRLKRFRVYRGNIREKKKIVTKESDSDEDSIWPRLTALSSLVLLAPPTTPAKGLPTDSISSSFFRSCSKLGSLPSLVPPNEQLPGLIISPSSQEGICHYFIDKKVAIPRPKLPPRPPPKPVRPPTPPKEPTPPPTPKVSPPPPSMFAPLPIVKGPPLPYPIGPPAMPMSATPSQSEPETQSEAEFELDVYPPLNYLTNFFSTSPLPDEVENDRLAEHVLLSEFIFKTNVVHSTVTNFKRHYPHYYLLVCKQGRITEIYDIASSTADIYTTQERKFASGHHHATEILMTQVKWITSSSWPPATFSISLSPSGRIQGVEVSTTRKAKTFHPKIWLRTLDDVIWVERIQAVYIIINGIVMLLGIAGIRIQKIKDAAMSRLKDELLSAFDDQLLEELLIKFRYLRRSRATIEAAERLFDILELCRTKGLVWKIVESIYMFDDYWVMVKTGVVLDALIIAAAVRDSYLLIDEMASCFSLPNNKFFSTIEEFRIVDNFVRDQMKHIYRSGCLKNKTYY